MMGAIGCAHTKSSYGQRSLKSESPEDTLDLRGRTLGPIYLSRADSHPYHYGVVKYVTKMLKTTVIFLFCGYVDVLL